MDSPDGFKNLSDAINKYATNSQQNPAREADALTTESAACKLDNKGIDGVGRES